MDIKTNSRQVKATIEQCTLGRHVMFAWSPFQYSSVVSLWLIGDPAAPPHCCYYCGFRSAAFAATALIDGL
eukprot:scaffold57384_cov14-Tisochrysis_lutea.AAC.1